MWVDSILLLGIARNTGKVFSINVQASALTVCPL